MEQQVQRYFEMDSNGVLSMYSRIEGEFGPVFCTCSGRIVPQTHPDVANFFVSITQEISSDDSEFFQFRLGEMNYFLQVFSMYNPQIKKDYGLSQTSQDES